MAADLCSVADVKALAGKSGNSTDDTTWAMLVTAASDFIRKETEKPYAATPMNRLLDGNGGCELFLPGGTAWTSPTSVIACGIPIPAQIADFGTGYYLDSSGRLLCLNGYSFPKGKKNIRVVGSCGSDSIPPRIAQACREIVIWAMKRGTTATNTSETDGPSNQQIAAFSMLAIPPTAALIIENERNKVPVT